MGNGESLCAGLLVGFLIGVGLVVLLGAWKDAEAITKWHTEAVQHGAAEYYLDENHTAQWRWKEAEHGK